jgi:hypothetical protein
MLAFKTNTYIYIWPKVSYWLVKCVLECGRQTLEPFCVVVHRYKYRSISYAMSQSGEC